MAFGALQSRAPHDSHPRLGHLILLVFEAVMEVVCVSLPGYIVARQGMFDADKQKFVANLNVALFTPCLSKFHKALRTGSANIDSFHEAGITIEGR
jgi:auxin efflux carrier family protein